MMAMLFGAGCRIRLQAGILPRAIGLVLVSPVDVGWVGR